MLEPNAVALAGVEADESRQMSHVLSSVLFASDLIADSSAADTANIATPSDACDVHGARDVYDASDDGGAYGACDADGDDVRDGARDDALYDGDGVQSSPFTRLSFHSRMWYNRSHTKRGHRRY